MSGLATASPPLKWAAVRGGPTSVAETCSVYLRRFGGGSGETRKLEILIFFLEVETDRSAHKRIQVYFSVALGRGSGVENDCADCPRPNELRLPHPRKVFPVALFHFCLFLLPWEK